MTIVRTALMAATTALTLWGGAAAAQAFEEIDNPGRILASNCFQCHGTDGQGARGGFERLEVREIVSEMREMARQTNPRGEKAIMVIHAQAYSTQQVALIADYLATMCQTCSPDDGGGRERVRLRVTRSQYGDVVSDIADLTCLEACDRAATRLDRGTSVTLTAVPVDGHRFRRWRGDCDGRTPTCTLDITSGRSATAVFGR